MTLKINRQWRLKSVPAGAVSADNFEWGEAPVPELAPGTVLVRNRLLSIDPANRAWMNGATYRGQLQVGQVMEGFALGEVVQSGHPSFKPGDIVDGLLGWQDYCAIAAAELTPRRADLPLDLQVGLLGITGLTAYHGMLDVGRIRAGETVVISSAAGAVGSIAGQIARLSGCRVIGIAGGEEKCCWLVDELGFHGAVDYKRGDLRRALRSQCPDGIDVYLDNVGGEVLDAALASMNVFGRVVCCGAISQYNVAQRPPGPIAVPGVLVVKRIRMEGFLVSDYQHMRNSAEKVLSRWSISSGLKPVVDVSEGLETAPATLQRMFEGRCRGKVCVNIA